MYMYLALALKSATRRVNRRYSIGDIIVDREGEKRYNYLI